MVLRGTKTRPEQADLLDIQKHIARLKLLIDSLEEQESDVEKEIEDIIEISDEEKTKPTIEQLKTGQYNEIEIPTNVSESIKVSFRNFIIEFCN